MQHGSAHASQHLATWVQSYGTDDLGQSAAHAGGSRSKAGPLFTYSFQPQPHGLLLFLYHSSFLFSPHFLSLNCYFFCSSPFVTVVYLALMTSHSPPHTHTSLIQEMKTECGRKGEEERQVVQALEEEKEGLTSRCAALRADLEEKERQANSQRDQRDAAQARVKVRTRGQVHLYRKSPRPLSFPFLCTP